MHISYERLRPPQIRHKRAAAFLLQFKFAVLSNENTHNSPGVNCSTTSEVFAPPLGQRKRFHDSALLPDLIFSLKPAGIPAGDFHLAVFIQDSRKASVENNKRISLDLLDPPCLFWS